MKFIVTGGTGLTGSKVVERLRAQGHEAIAASPSTGIDVITGDGLDAAMDGADVVVDLANSPSFKAAEVLEFFRTASRRVLAAAARAGVHHHLVLSLVGSGKDRLRASDYFRAKAEQEALLRGSDIPYTIVQSTQFFEFLPRIIDAAADGDVIRLPPALVQPIASEDVAAAVARFALQPPANAIVEIAGPQKESLAALAQRFMFLVEDPREVVIDAGAPYFGAELALDTLIPSPSAWIGPLNFERWLGFSEFVPPDMPRDVAPFCRP